MSSSTLTGEPRSITWDVDPRRSLAASAMWLIIGLAFTFSIAAALWVGSISRENVVEQHVRRLSLETDQLGSDVGQAIAARLGAVRAARTMLRDFDSAGQKRNLGEVFSELESTYPELDWIGIADSSGAVIGASGSLPEGSIVNERRWFVAGSKGPWLGLIELAGKSSREAQDAPAAGISGLGDLAAPVKDKAGRVVGVIAAHLSWQRSQDHPQRLTDESDPRDATQAYVLDRDGIILIGPDDTRGSPWSAVEVDAGSKMASAIASLGEGTAAPRFERLPDGRRMLVSRAPLSIAGVPPLGWQVQLCEPNERVFQRANALALKILWVSLCLGAATALVGTLGARHLTRRLKRLTLSVASFGTNSTARIEVPAGMDEVALLGEAFAKILGDLHRERSELKTLSGELERRVEVRTREVERLAEESRYAAVVRERLKIARDLHDTLAHSMMALLSEIRLLRRLHVHDPGAVAEELARAEAVAHDGLKEARTAITQMRVNAVRDTGLGPALSAAFDRFIDHNGLSGEFSADADAARFGDERAETILRMAQEVLRNIERHAMATRVLIRLQTTDETYLELCVEDNGVGFDPEALRPGHYGIVGLREQAELIGAQLRIESRAQHGTTIRITMPLSPISFTQRF